jgi:hypothetical protein
LKSFHTDNGSEFLNWPLLGHNHSSNHLTFSKNFLLTKAGRGDVEQRLTRIPNRQFQSRRRALTLATVAQDGF